MNYLRWFGISVVLFAAAFGWLIAPYDAFATGLGLPNLPPGQFALGTDTLGRDVLSRILFGGPLTLSSGLISTAVAWLIGGVLGCSQVLGPVRLQDMMRVLNLSLLSLPSIVVALVLVTALGTNMALASVAVGVAQVGVAAQVWRGAAEAVKHEPFLAAADALGATRFHSLREHVIPNVMPVLAAYGITLFASSILLLSALGFLGVAGEPASPDWGNMIAEGRRAIRYAPWIMIVPSLALVVVTSVVGQAAVILVTANRRTNL